MKSICYLNGRYLDTGKARISPFDRGFLFGEGLFETWRTYRGRPYAIAEHLRRMAQAARRLGIHLDTDEPWERRCLELARRNRMTDRDGAIRLTITRGWGATALVVEETRAPTTLMVFRPLEPGLATARSQGVAVHPVCVGSGVSEKQRQIKSLNYLPAVLARSEARARGAFEAIYHTDDGTVLEGTTSNVFLVRRGIVRTAPISLGLLPGVTRAKALRLARRAASVREEAFTLEELADADEAFLTASSIEVFPLVRLGGRRVGNGKPGEFARSLQGLYRADVARTLDMAVDELGE
jgi:branched-chain amino acid aminotransferase